MQRSEKRLSMHRYIVKSLDILVLLNEQDTQDDGGYYGAAESYLEKVIFRGSMHDILY
jgi:hypothetical protein